MIPYEEMETNKQRIAIVTTILLVIGIFIVSMIASRGTLRDVDLHEIPFFDDPELFVVRVIDGDTIEVIGGDRVRYIGIDAPEMDDECFAEEATERNRELVDGKHVRLERDVSNRDDFGRLLRYVHVDNVFVNETLVREGYARAVSYPPDTAYQDVLEDAEQEAREHERGLWTECE